jgi:acyl-CoA thioester hydrolase
MAAFYSSCDRAEEKPLNLTLQRDDFHHFEPIDVRWGDMDAMGHVNNACYFTYCESARMSYFQAILMNSHREAPKHGPALVSATCNFRRQVHWPARLEVGARAGEIHRRSFELEYGIFDRETGEVVADGTSVVVWVDYDAGKAIPLPEGLKTAILDLEGRPA